MNAAKKYTPKPACGAHQKYTDESAHVAQQPLF